MVQKSPAFTNQLRWSSSLSYYLQGFKKTSQKWLALGFLNHQQYPPLLGHVWVKMMFQTSRFPLGYTPPKINMEPQSEGLEDDFPFQRAVFQVPR